MGVAVLLVVVVAVSPAAVPLLRKVVVDVALQQGLGPEPEFAAVDDALEGQGNKYLFSVAFKNYWDYITAPDVLRVFWIKTI